MSKKSGKGFTIKEPVYGNTLTITTLPIDELKVIEIQRKPSPQHIRRLMDSMKKIGFIVPVVVIKKGEQYYIIDGQHRYLAGKELGVKELPCVIVDEKYAFDLMELNVEKQMSLRERCYVALNVYRWYINVDENKQENDGEVVDSIEFPYYVTLGLAYEKDSHLFGSAYESILKRVDGFLELPLKDALNVREERAERILSVERRVREVVDKLKESGINHPFLHKEVVSFANPIGRKRIVERDFDEVMDELERKVSEVLKHPEIFRMAGETEVIE